MTGTRISTASRSVPLHTTTTADYRLHLGGTRNLTDITLQRALGLYSLSVRIGALGFGRATFTSETRVLVVANFVLAETTDDLLLLVPQTFNPVLHTLHHFALYSGGGIVEVGVEATTKAIDQRGTSTAEVRTGTEECLR